MYTHVAESDSLFSGYSYLQLLVLFYISVALTYYVLNGKFVCCLNRNSVTTMTNLECMRYYYTSAGIVGWIYTDLQIHIRMHSIVSYINSIPLWFH